MQTPVLLDEEDAMSSDRSSDVQSICSLPHSLDDEWEGIERRYSECVEASIETHYLGAHQCMPYELDMGTESEPGPETHTFAFRRRRW